MNNIAIIYYLDDTIFPTKSIPASTFQPVFNAIKHANNGFLTEKLLETALEDLWVKPMDIVAKEYGFNDAMINAAKTTLTNSTYELSLTPFADYHFITKIPGKRFLVTTGITNLQQAKINSLIKDGGFDEIIIDDPYHLDRLGKKSIFRDLAARYKLLPANMLIVGDNPDSEIAAGNALGMKTIQILRPGVQRDEQATYVIQSFSEISNLIKSYFIKFPNISLLNMNCND